MLEFDRNKYFNVFWEETPDSVAGTNGLEEPDGCIFWIKYPKDSQPEGSTKTIIPINLTAQSQAKTLLYWNIYCTHNLKPQKHLFVILTIDKHNTCKIIPNVCAVQ